MGKIFQRPAGGTATETEIETVKDSVPGEQIDARNAERDAQRRKRIEAKTIIRKFAETCDNQELKAAIYLIIGTGQRTRRTKAFMLNQDIIKTFKEKKSVSEMEAFNLWKVGRPEMTAKIRMMIREQDPENRLWVNFDADKEVYTLVGTGPNPPDGWDGYIPAAE